MPLFTKRICSVLLLVLFSWFVTPKEVLHAFSHHVDSEHTDTGHRLQFTKAHHHCALLQADQQFNATGIELPQFLLNPQQPPSSPKPLQIYQAPQGLSTGRGLCLRGPPASFG